MKTMDIDKVITRRLVLSLSLPLVGLLIATSAVGLFYPGIYTSATPGWTTQTLGQDGVDLFLIVPLLMISCLYSINADRLALSVWGGTNIYIVYTFVIYCFDVRFNPLFVLYCLILGLASFSTTIFLYHLGKAGDILQVTSRVRKLIGYYFIAISAVFYFTWLSDILPAIAKGVMPASVQEAGLFTNPVQVLDLAIVLPAVFVIGILVLKGNSFAINLATVFLVFFILMDITIAALALLLFRKGMEESYSVAVIMGILSVLSLSSIILLRKNSLVIPDTKIWS
jgi:hypothetical protein